MKDDERTMYVNGTSDDDKESTIYIGKNQPENIEEKNEKEGNTVYIGNEDAAIATSVIAENVQSQDSAIELETVNETTVPQDNTLTDRSVSDPESDSDGALYYLPTNTMLQKRYRINSALGEGGFGITYSGWDVTLNIPVAIKEYYPSGLVTRNATLGKTTQVVPVASAKYGTQFRDGIDRVLDEARRMAKFRNTQGIVGIYDFFEANNTAYIVMEYIEGVTLDTYCKNNRMDNTTLFNMLVPVMDALQALHNEGIIHRDISPDNIMVDNEGNFKLLDFGAARGYSEESSTTMSVILKKSYAPEEQFRTKGNQGPWTDVYALGATIYELITGQTPPTSIDRLAEDDIVNIKDCAPSLTKGQSEAIMTALAVRQKDRWQSMNEFKIALLQGVENKGKNIQKKNDVSTSASSGEQKDANPKKNYFSSVYNWIKQNKKKSGIVLICFIILACILAFVNKNSNDGPGYLGVYSSDVPENVKTEYNVGDGTFVTGVIANTPAAKSGFVAGDILLSLDNNILTGEKDFSTIITRYNAGDKVKIKYLHITKNGIYEEKTKTVKLANKNEQDEVAFTVSSINNDSSNNSAESNFKDLSVEFVGAEKSSSTSKYLQVYLKFNNPNDDTLNASIKNISLNGAVVSTFANAEGLIGNQDTILKFQVDHSDVIAGQIGDIISTIYIQYYYEGEYNNTRECTYDNFEYSISSKAFINNTDSVSDTDENNESTDISVPDVDETESVVEDENTTHDDSVNDTATSSVASSDDIVVSLSSIKEGSSYTYLYFTIENNSDKDITLKRDWVYLNDTAIERATSDGLLELEPHTGSVIKYAFKAADWNAAKGSSVKKLELGFKLNGSSEAILFEISNTNVNDSVSRLIGSEMDRMRNASVSKNIEVAVSEIKEGSSYTYVTFTVKNISSNTIDLGKSWAFVNGTAVYRATSDGSHSLAPGKASVIKYAYDQKIIDAAKGDNFSIIRLQFYINDAEEPELFYFNK